MNTNLASTRVQKMTYYMLFVALFRRFDIDTGGWDGLIDTFGIHSDGTFFS